jgi:hypothetical protein
LFVESTSAHDTASICYHPSYELSFSHDFSGLGTFIPITRSYRDDALSEKPGEIGRTSRDAPRG